MHPYIGKTLGQYQLVEQIGQGGMATVFKAYQASMDRYVAVKTLPSQFTQDASFIGRFNQEARLLANLEHPHILPVYDYGEHEGITYLVMRYITAGTLHDVIAARGRMELNQVAHIIGQMGRALGYAHARGILHRDVKPSNVLIDAQFNSFLTDFGIAKLIAGTANFTGTGAVIGTPAYMAPEQGLGKPLDARCDIYALGVMLYEMVTGAVPYAAETPLAVLMMHIHDPLPPPRLIRPDLPEAVERVILKALAKVPEARFDSAEQMAETLERAVAGLPTAILESQPTAVLPSAPSPALTAPVEAVAPPAKTALMPPRPAARRFPWIPVGGGLAILATLLLLVFWGLPRLRAPGEIASPTQPGSDPGAVVSGPWTNYTNANFITALARQDDYLWAGGPGGLVRWDIETKNYVKYTVADGLVSNIITALLVDGEDNLWIGTDAGLHRFDGEELLTFGPREGLDSDVILALFEDADGGIWAGTAYGERGLNYYDGERWGASPLPPLPVEFPKPVALAGEYPEEEFLVGLTDEGGLAHYNGATWEIYHRDPAQPDSVRALLLTEEYLLVSFGNEVVAIHLESGDWESIRQLDFLEEILALRRDEEGRVWFNGWGGAARYDPEADEWQYFAGGADVPAWGVLDVIPESDGVWVGTYDNGVFFYNFDQRAWEPWRIPEHLGSNDIWGIAQDGAGALWFISGGQGLTRYAPQHDAWTTYREADGAFDWPTRPAIDPEGRLWVGGYSALKWFDGQRWQTLEPEALSDVAVYGLAFAPDGMLWGYAENLVWQYDRAADRWTTFSAAAHPALASPYALAVAADGAVWVGGEHGLARYDGGAWHTAPAYQISHITLTRDEQLWVVAEGSLYHLNGDTWERIIWPVEDWIETAAVAPDGRVWAGHHALGVYDPATRQWELFTTAEGLVHNYIHTIYVTPEGVVWIGTAAGVSRFEP